MSTNEKDITISAALWNRISVVQDLHVNIFEQDMQLAVSYEVGTD